MNETHNHKLNTRFSRPQKKLRHLHNLSISLTAADDIKKELKSTHTFIHNIRRQHPKAQVLLFKVQILHSDPHLYLGP
jgi:hypothetical protein